MSEGLEIFRVYLGSVAALRDPDQEHRRIAQIKLVLAKIGNVISKEDRLQFSLDVCKQSFRQWLVVYASASLQRQLFEFQSEAPFAPFGSTDSFSDSVAAQVRQAFGVLNALAHASRVTPSMFHQIAEDFEVPVLSALLRNKQPLEVRTNDGQTISADPPCLPNRTQLPDEVTIQLTVELSGHGKALVRLPKVERRLHRVRDTRLMLYWSPLSHPWLLQSLRDAQDRMQLLSSAVCLVVDRTGHTRALEFRSLLQAG